MESLTSISKKYESSPGELVKITVDIDVNSDAELSSQHFDLILCNPESADLTCALATASIRQTGDLARLE